MSTQTTNLQLTKPDVTDAYDIGVQNENMDKIDTFYASHTSHKADTSVHITSEERTAWNNMLNNSSASATAERATADAEGNNIIDTYATKALLENNIATTKTSLEGTIAATKTSLENSIATAKASIDNNIASTNHRKIDFEDIVGYFKNSGTQLILTGFLVDNLMSISVSGYVDSATASGGANVKLEQLVDSSVFGDFFEQVNIDLAVPMIDGSVRNAVVSVVVGDNVITEFTFTKNGQAYKTFNYNDYGNDSSYEMTDMQTHSGVSIYFQNMLDSSYIKYPLAINVATSRIVE